MYFRLIVTFALALASAKDLEIGLCSDEACKIFDEEREASPAIWRQSDTITVNTNGNEVISRVVITDLRPDKDGDAKIIEGGVGNHSVTIELKSPTVLRGFHFNIEVYAVPENKEGQLTPVAIGNDNTKDQSKPTSTKNDLRNIGENQPPRAFGADSTKTPESLSTDIKFNDGKRSTRSSEDGKPIDHTIPDYRHPTSSSTTEKALEPNLAKNVPVTITKDAEDLIHPVKPEQDSTPSHKTIEASTLPSTTFGHNMKAKDEHTRNTRDTAKVSQTTTQAPSTVGKTENSSKDAAKDLKEDNDQAIVYPQWHVDKSGNTDKLLIPGKVMTHDLKHETIDVDGRSTTAPSTTAKATEKPRAVRGTEVTTHKTDLKSTTEQSQDTHIQKIASNGRVEVPKEFKDFQDSTANIGLDKDGEAGKTPASYVPEMPIPFHPKNILSGSAIPSQPPTAFGAGNPSLSSSDKSKSTESSSSEEHWKPDALLATSKPLSEQKDKKPVISPTH